MFRLPSGLLVSVCRADDPNRSWRPHRLRRPLAFESEYRTPTVYGSSGAAIFREADWLILTRHDRIERIA